MNKKEKITILFGGFYHTLASEVIDNRLWLQYGDIDNYESHDDQPYEGVYSEYCENNYKEYCIEYCIDYCKLLEKWIKKELDIEISIEFNKLCSPKEYNFRTDEIEATVPTHQLNNLYARIKNTAGFGKELIELIDQNTRSWEGYQSFYSYNQVIIDNKDNMLFTNVFEYLCEKMGKEYAYYELSEY